MADTTPKGILGRITISMVLAGVGVGLASLFVWEWVEAIVLAELEGVEFDMVAGIVPLVLLIIAAISAPIFAGVLGIFEGLRMTENKTALYIGIGCFVGAALMVFVAGVFIGFTGVEEENGGGGPGAADLVSLAGLSAMTSLVVGAGASILGTK